MHKKRLYSVKVWGKKKCKTCVVRVGKCTGKEGGQ